MKNTQQRAAAVGLDNIMSAYDLMSEGGDYPCFSVWYNRDDKAIQWNKADAEKGRDYLKGYFEILQDSGDNSMYYVKIHSTPGIIYNKKSDEICSFPVRANPFHQSEFDILPQGQTQVAGIGNGGRIQQLLEGLPGQLQEKFDAINLRIDELSAEEPEEEKPDMLGRITGMLDHPTIGPAIGGFLTMVLPKLLAMIPGALTPTPTPNMAMQPVINGVNDTNIMTEEQKDELVNVALDRLEPYCDLASDLTLLANMAEKNPKMFEMLLSTLRAQK
jgi:hypothetical protein